MEQPPEVVAQHRVQPDGGLVEHQQLGLADQRAGERGPALLPAGEPPDQVAAAVGQADRVERPRRALGRDAEHGGEVAGVLATVRSA